MMDTCLKQDDLADNASQKNNVDAFVINYRKIINPGI